jgi:hypothetical protein
LTDSDREGLVARIRHVGRLATTLNRPHPQAEDPPPDRVRDLEARVKHLEQLVVGLQDSVYRESERHSKLITELQAQVQPEVMGAALAEDARNRGL